jgi:molybdenum cofactor cytidylyltransferase
VNGERLAALVLAAGRSSRMGDLKPLLEVEGRTLLEWAVGAFTGAGFDDVIVVTGHRGDEVAVAAARAGAVPVANPGFDGGMFSSVRAGVAALDPGVTRFFLLPADVPLVRPETIGRVARAGRLGLLGDGAERPAPAGPGTAPEVLYPAVAGVTGHPPIIAASLRAEILAAGPGGPEGGLRALLMGHIADSAIVEVDDAGVLLDADTPEDLALIRKRAAGEGLPDEMRCQELLAENDVPESRVAHSRAVAAVAAALAAALDARGQHLCEPLVLAGGMLHDIARSLPRHPDAGADLLEGLGYRRVAAVVRQHMELPREAGRDVDEAQVVFLADKLVRGDRVVGLEERFAVRLVRHRDDAVALAAVHRRKAQAETVLANVEQVLGRPVETVLAAI